MREKEGTFSEYKTAFTAAFTLLLLGAIMILIANYIINDANIERSYGDLDDAGYKNARETSLLMATFGSLIIIIGGILLAIKTFYLALESDLIESENVRAGLLVFVGLILAFVAIRGGSFYVYYFF
ncbi:MAG: hypothetical protein ACFE68_03200 [Candidatus Hodarchaeota archaeon]